MTHQSFHKVDIQPGGRMMGNLVQFEGYQLGFLQRRGYIQTAWSVVVTNWKWAWYRVDTHAFQHCEETNVVTIPIPSTNVSEFT